MTTENWETRRFDQGACLHCGKKLNGITGPGHTPQKGSIMVCIYCHYVMEWGGEGFVELSDEAMKEIEHEPELQEALALTRAFRAMEEGKPLELAEALREAGKEVKVLVLEPLAPEICEDCGKLDELRPYGLRKANGVRKWVCFACAQKNPAEAERAFEERIEGNNPV